LLPAILRAPAFLSAVRLLPLACLLAAACLLAGLLGSRSGAILLSNRLLPGAVLFTALLSCLL
jgi:hypothetical protein